MGNDNQRQPSESSSSSSSSYETAALSQSSRQEEPHSLYCRYESADFFPQLFRYAERHKLTDQAVESVVNRLCSQRDIEISSDEVKWKSALAVSHICHLFDKIATAIVPDHQVQRRFVFLDRGALPYTEEQFESWIDPDPTYLPLGDSQCKAWVVPDMALVPIHLPRAVSDDRLLIPPLFRNWSTLDLIVETKDKDRPCVELVKRHLLALICAQPYRMFSLGLAYDSHLFKVLRLDQCGYVSSTDIDTTKLDGLKTMIQLLTWLTTVSPQALGEMPGTVLEWSFGPMQFPKTSGESCRYQLFRRFSRLVINTSFLPRFSSSVTLSIGKMIANDSGFQGRGTRVWKVKVETHHPLSSLTLVLKISFQPARFDGAGHLWPTVETKFHQDFPASDWYQSSIVTAETGMVSDAKLSIEQIRGFKLQSPIQDRVMAIHVIRQVQLLDTIDDIVVLLGVLVNIIEAVQTLYDQGYLHRDLSFSNVGYVPTKEKFVA